MSLPHRPADTGARFFLRRRDRTVTGPHEKPELLDMLARGELDGQEAIAIDKRTWKPIGLLIGQTLAGDSPQPKPVVPRTAAPPPLPPRAGGQPPAPPRGAPAARPAPPALKAEPARGLRLDFVDLPGEEPAPQNNVDPAAPREGFTSLSVGVTVGSGRTVSEPPPAAASRPRSATSLGLGPSPITLGTAEDVPFDAGLSLELVERKPAQEAKPAREKETTLSPRLDAPTARSLDSGPGLDTRANQPITERAAPGTVAVSAPSP
ncbi:MAG TPA: hypothetical protein VHU40_16865, partial [Polyangia bacterium]|nr:hypothetical protein [Polyangia bacterium]